MNCTLTLIKSSQLGQLKQFFASTLRLQKRCDPASLPLKLANQSRYLSLNNVTFKDTVDSRNEKSNIVKKVKYKKGFSAADDNLIAKQIEMYGRNPATGKKLAKEIGLKETSYHAIFRRHKFHIANQPTVKGDFSLQEDKNILDYVNKNGRSKKTIENLTLLLGRGSPQSVINRLLALSSETVLEPKQWTLEEDEIMVKYIVNFLVKDSNELPEQIKLSDFKKLALEMQRSPKSVYLHYYDIVLPVLKTHTRGLPLEENWMWQKHLMLYVIKKKIEKTNDINYYDLLAEKSFVGQTCRSLSKQTAKWQYKAKVLTNDILWKMVEKIYHDKHPQLLCYNEKFQTKRLKSIQNIIEVYESSKNNQL